MSKFRKMLVKIICENEWVGLFEDGKKSRAYQGEIQWKYCLTFLRHFGQLISKLEIDNWDVNLKFAVHLDPYVNEYCAESLTEISFVECQTEMMQDLKKPFRKVESVRFEGCNLGSELSSINKWFLYVRHLEVHLLHLISLAMFLPGDKNENRLSKGNLTEILRLNPQLQTLEISIVITGESIFKVLAHTYRTCKTLSLLDIFQILAMNLYI